ncbi:AraC family transcriptional regulator [Cohnella lubricantis]|uniref:Helix-turn-helix transcriptional regulator n=1 Tax=Cohnella lubricantis TaxID=2163172 RepID=A0A841TBP5_9BACL|nr:AraC family transcriptional regulator [Cohnella lubricantis]MBB6676798.1 helix-turn-helix transcriptional regulator [Cohnella lubricantis]MBP2118114.1 AraC-like DNA-binding protein [Cohnella lubricantis]
METDFDQLQDLFPDIVFFVDRRCFPNWEIIEQTIDFHDLTFVVGGKTNYFVDGVQYTIEAGDVIYIPVGSVRQAHTFKQSPAHSYAFNFKWLPNSRTDPLPLQTVTKNVITSELIGYLKQYSHIWMSKQPGYVMQARALFMLIIHRLITITSRNSALIKADHRVNQVISFVAEHYPEELDLSRMAQIVNLHPVYLGKLFKQYMGYSFKEYLNMIRVNHAEMLLSTGGFSVSQVAERCGFRDISYFSNVFKSVKGYPPSTVFKCQSG